jgi:hypothetical protein
MRFLSAVCLTVIMGLICCNTTFGQVNNNARGKSWSRIDTTRKKAKLRNFPKEKNPIDSIPKMPADRTKPPALDTVHKPVPKN